MGRKKKPRQDAPVKAVSAATRAAQRAFLDEMIILSKRGRSATIQQTQNAVEATADWEQMIGRLEAWARAISRTPER